MRGRSAVLLLNQKEISNQMKVRKFLESISRSSLQTMKVYKIGLSNFQTFLKDTFGINYTLESILDALSTNEMNVYRLIDEFISYILYHSKDARLSSSSLRVYLAAVRSYLAYYDIDIVTTKFRRKIKIPRYCREDEQAIDATDIRSPLLSCSNRRLKAYLLVLASGGMRAVEALAIRNKDLNFSVKPTIVQSERNLQKRESQEISTYLMKLLPFLNNG